jgi:hypothetical protein
MFAFSEKVVSISVKKPNPCYSIESYSIEASLLKVKLRMGEPNRICPQVIVYEKLRLETGSEIKEVEIYIDSKLWDRYQVP